MPSSPTSRKPLVLAGAGAVSALAVVLSVLTGTVAALGCLAVLGGGLVAMLRLARQKPVPSWTGRVGIVAGLVLMGAVTVLDGSWVSGLLVALSLAVVTVLWLALAKQLAPAAALSGAVRSALSLAECTLVPDSAGGWHLATTPGGAVLLLREIATEAGAVAEWAAPTAAAESATSTLQLLKSQGIVAVPVLLTTDGTVGPTTVGAITVCSASRLPVMLSRVTGSALTPAAAAAAGVAPNRQVARQMTKTAAKQATKASGSTSAPTSRVQHQGRVTKKKA